MSKLFTPIKDNRGKTIEIGDTVVGYWCGNTVEGVVMYFTPTTVKVSVKTHYGFLEGLVFNRGVFLLEKSLFDNPMDFYESRLREIKDKVTDPRMNQIKTDMMVKIINDYKRSTK